jgi:hypothetical protein
LCILWNSFESDVFKCCQLAISDTKILKSRPG